MAVADVHPSVEELAAFTLGTLGDETQVSIEAHVADCSSCQERAAVAPSDTLVELLRRVHAGTGRRADTSMDAAAHVQTPLPLSAVAVTDALAPVMSVSAPVESDYPEIPDALPPELARHERYRIVRLLGVGGMGTVYEAEHLVLHQPRALKVIKRAYTASAAALDRFRREVRAAARLSHPNIVTTHDAEDAGETHFLVMEYVEGIDLGRLVQERGPLPVDRACDYIRQAALGLQHAFEQSMVHRDLKPHNLMRTPDGRVKILDFGLARFASEAADAAGLTSTGIVLGTVDYIAPEQADNAHQADIRSDIYSLGCTLYHLLAGQPPFPTGTPLQKVMAHMQKKPQPLTELRDDLPEELMPVLERMMAKDPKHRYQTPAEVALALEPFTRAPKPRPRVRAADADHTVVLKKEPVGERWRPRLMIAPAILAFVIAGMLGVAVYRIATDEGQLVITTESDDVKVVITRGGKLIDVIDTKTDTQIRLALRSGEYELALKEAPVELKLNVEKATLTRGKESLVKIERIKKEPSAQVGEVRRFVGHTDRVWGVSLSPNGRYALSTSGDGSLRLWDLQSGIEIRSYPGHAGPTHAVAFLPDGREFLSCSNDGTMRHWQTETGKQLHSADLHPAIYDVAVSPDGLLALAAHADKTLHLWDLKNWREIRRFEGHTGAVQRVVFSADGRLALSGSHDKTVRLWDVETGKELRCFEGHQAGWGGVAISPDGRLALNGGEDALVRLWDLKTGKELRQFQGHRGDVHGVAFSPDGRLALSAGPGGDKSIRLWDVATGKELYRFDGHEESVYSVVFSRDGLYALSGSYDGTMRLWRLPDLPPAEKVGEIRRFGTPGHTIRRLALSPDGQRLLTAGCMADGTARYWDIATGKEIYQLPSKGGQVYGVAISPDGTKLLSCGDDRLIHVWDAATGQEVKQLKGHTDRVIGVAVSPDGRMVASSGYDCQLRLWNLDTGELIASPGNAGGGEGAAFSPDGKLIATWARDHIVRLWDVKNRKEVRRLEGHKEWVVAAAFSPDGSRLLSGTWPSDDSGPVARPSDLKLWEVSTGKLLRTIDLLPGDNVHGLAISPDGRQALSCSGSGGPADVVELWDLERGKPIIALRGHIGVAADAAFLPGGRTAVSVGYDATIRLWQLPALPPRKEKP